LPLDHPDIHIYRQSYVPAHSELTWILDCFTGFGEMERMTQFKDKSAKLESGRVSLGLFNYPVLMAADILLYGAAYVPVGEDQTQHLEFTRDIAMRLNNRFGILFTVPKSAKEQHTFFGKDQGLRIKDLADPTKKMSKSDDTGKGVIFLGDTPEAAVKKVKSAATDSLAKIDWDWEKQPGITNLLQIYELLSGKPHDAVMKEWKGKDRYGDFKSAVAETVSDFLKDFQTRLEKVDNKSVLKKLKLSEAAMNKQANATLLKVQKAVGLRP
jgi:tryptophanyl-tRNA synthetase